MSHLTRMHLRAVSLLALFAILLTAAATAMAAPPTPTMGVTELRAKIEAAPGNVLSGYLKTVLRGSTVSIIPVRVLAVTTGQPTGPESLASLILFEATGPEIDRMGGIASGMSGSPIYVNDNGTDKLIGALSYGDILTKNGAGLATPIEAMAEIEGYPYTSQQLDRPVRIDGALKDRLVITNDVSKAKATAEKDTLVFGPKSEMRIGGINPASPLFRDYAATLEKHGVKLVAPLAGGLGSQVAPYSAPFEPGGSIAVLAARGDFWAGGIGTVTYVNGRNVVAFGHPAFWAGNSGAYLCNAWIDGIWGSGYSPYKLGRPAALRGTLTQDRLAGIMGVDGMLPTETPISARATDDGTNRTASSSVMMPSRIINTFDWNYYGLAPMGAYIAGTRLFDQSMTPGSANTTTTVVIRDGERLFTLVRPNVIDDGYDVPSAVVSDVNQIVGELEMANTNGIAHAEIVSVDLQSRISRSRRLAEVVSVEAPRGLRVGDNTVRVLLHAYGKPDTQSVDVTLTIPAGVSTTGELNVDTPNMESDASMKVLSATAIDRRTTAEVVEGLLDYAPNNLLTISFAPEDLGSSTSTRRYESIEATRLTDFFLTGSVYEIAPGLTAKASPSTIAYRGTTVIHGEVITDESSEATITVYGRASGETTEQLLAQTTVDPDSGTYRAKLPPLTKTTRVRVHFEGDDDNLAAEKTLTVRVRAKVTLSSSARTVNKGSAVTLRVAVAPGTATGRVVFERWSGRRWVSVRRGTQRITAGVTRLRYTPPAGTVRLRARYVPGTGATNIAKTSSSITLKVK